MDAYELEWARAFVLTLAIELPLYALLLGREGFGTRTATGAALAANSLSHPCLWFVFPRFEPYEAFAAAGEILVVALEAGVLLWWARMARLEVRWKRVLIVVVAANAASVALGLVV